MVKFHQSLSEESVHFRYFGSLSVEKRIAHERLIRTCFNDYDREIALVAELKKSEATPEILGIGRLVRTRELDDTEFAILIADAWQGKGLGSALLKRLVETGRAEKVKRIMGLILGENRTMLEVCRNVGFKLQWQSDYGEWKAEIRL